MYSHPKELQEMSIVLNTLGLSSGTRNKKNNNHRLTRTITVSRVIRWFFWRIKGGYCGTVCKHNWQQNRKKYIAQVSDKVKAVNYSIKICKCIVLGRNLTQNGIDLLLWRMRNGNHLYWKFLWGMTGKANQFILLKVWFELWTSNYNDSPSS